MNSHVPPIERSPHEVLGDRRCLNL